MDSVSIELKCLAEKADLPMKILECLVQTGFDTVTSVAELTDVKVVETLLRENHDIFQDSAKRARIYGIYVSTPENFSFLPGHVIRLNKFIDLCKSIAKNKELRLKRTLRAITNAVAAVHRTRSARCSYSDETSDAISRCRSEPPLSVTVSSPLLLDSQEHPPSPDTHHGSSSLELATYTDLKSKLKVWSDGNTDPDIKNLQLGQHYKIIVARKHVHDDVELVVESLFQINAYIFCCMCNKNVRMNVRKTTFAISNATRHLSLCVAKSSVKQKQLTISREMDVQQQERLDQQIVIIDGEVFSQ